MPDNPTGLVSTEQREITTYKWVHPDEDAVDRPRAARKPRTTLQKARNMLGLLRPANFADKSVLRDYGLRPIKAIVHADLHDVQRLFCNVVG
jgi:hypothetical protein